MQEYVIVCKEYTIVCKEYSRECKNMPEECHSMQKFMQVQVRRLHVPPYTTITLSLTGMLMTAVSKGVGLPLLRMKTLMGSVRPMSSRHSSVVSKP